MWRTSSAHRLNLFRPNMPSSLLQAFHKDYDPPKSTAQGQLLRSTCCQRPSLYRQHYTPRWNILELDLLSVAPVGIGHLLVLIITLIDSRDASKSENCCTCVMCLKELPQYAKTGDLGDEIKSTMWRTLVRAELHVSINRDRDTDTRWHKYTKKELVIYIIYN